MTASTLDHAQTVGEIVAERPGTSVVFERHGIDYCCGGKVPFGEACAKIGLNPDTLAAEIAALKSSGDVDDTVWTDRPLGELVDNIIATHHDYLRAELPRIAMKSSSVSVNHLAIEDQRMDRKHVHKMRPCFVVD